MVDRMMAEPTTRTVIVCPRPQRNPIKAAWRIPPWRVSSGRYGDAVVRIVRVGMPRKAKSSSDGKQRDHLFINGGSGPRTYAPAFEKLQKFGHSFTGFSR
jgi:hypothetical protein